MAKKIMENKAIGPDQAETKELDRSTHIEGRDALKPGEAEYNYPLEQITVVATSQEEADRKMEQVKSQRSENNEGEEI